MINAAIDLLLANGTSKTTLAAIGEAAGYSRGLATYRFGSKAGLFDEICKATAREWLKYLTCAVDGKTGIDAICAASDAYCDFVTQSPRQARVLHLLYGEATNPNADSRSSALDTYARQRRDVIDWIEKGKSAGQVRPDAHAETIAVRFIAYIAGITHLWLIMPEAVDFAAANKDYQRQLRADLAPVSSGY